MARNGAAYGPLIPTLGAQGFWGGLGGGRDGIPDTFGGQQDYSVGVAWRLGPGGLFDFTRVRSAEARMKIAELSDQALIEPNPDLPGRIRQVALVMLHGSIRTVRRAVPTC